MPRRSRQADGTSTNSTYTAKYLTFDTPFSTTAGASQCGRAAFADIHVSNGYTASVFPTGCEMLTKTQEVTEFEFFFFDLGSCDSPTIAPPPSQ